MVLGLFVLLCSVARRGDGYLRMAMREERNAMRAADARALRARDGDHGEGGLGQRGARAA